MKKFAVALIILALLFSILPTSTVLAKRETSYVNLSVNNRTRANVTLILFDQNDNRLVFTYEPGMFVSTVLPGRYSYYVQTPCGVQAGQFNLNVNKILDFHCTKNVQKISLVRPFEKAACELMFWTYQRGKSGPIVYYVNYPPEARDYLIKNGQGGWACYDGFSPIIYVTD
jgi:hypothetical protein